MPRRAPNEIGRQDLFDLIQRLELKLKSGVSSDVCSFSYEFSLNTQRDF